MEVFSHNAKNYIAINGKEFFLIQGFREERWENSKLAFIQVIGRTPLTYEDLAEKNWKLIKTKTPKGAIFTAYNERFFDYESTQNRGDKKTFFIGRNKEGSLFLALFTIAKLLRKNVSPDYLKNVVKIILSGKAEQLPSISELKDQGNEGSTAYYINGLGAGYRQFSEDDLQEILTIRTKNGRK